MRIASATRRQASLCSGRARSAAWLRHAWLWHLHAAPPPQSPSWQPAVWSGHTHKGPRTVTGSQAILSYHHCNTQALASALGQAELLKEQLDRLHLLSRDSDRDVVASRLLHEPSQAPDQQQQNGVPTMRQLLLERAGMQRAAQLEDALVQVGVGG